MKVLDIYGKKDLDRLTVKGRVVSKIMNDFFKQFPSSCRENYDKNLETVEILRVDELCTGFHGGEYSDFHNIILFKRYYSLIHELMHMASCDHMTRRSSFERIKEGTLFEGALIEGFTEYLANVALNTKTEIYHFEVFTTSMLANIEGIFEPYFIPSYEKLISLFPNKRDIVSLMYSLNYYSNNTGILFADNSKFDDKLFMNNLEKSIGNVIDTLIDIQLSMNMGKRANKIYGDMFMSLISDEDVNAYLSDIWEDYLDYANEQVKKRILRRM